MALETRVSYNSDSSEFVSAQPIIYELISPHRKLRRGKPRTSHRTKPRQIR